MVWHSTLSCGTQHTSSRFGGVKAGWHAVTVPTLSQSVFVYWNMGNGGESVREPNILRPLLLIYQKRTFCATIVTIASRCAHLSTAYSPLVYWALNLACYLWQIYDYIHYSSNSFRQKLRGAQRKWIIQNNYTIKRLYQNTVIQHRNEMKDTGRNNGGVLGFGFVLFFFLTRIHCFLTKERGKRFKN